jgi:hypothetical protein
MAKPMREAMPTIAAFVDDLRAAFGKESIDGQIRAGINGRQAFHATENGQSIGTPLAPVEGVKMSETLLGPMSRLSTVDKAPKGKRK